MVEPPPEDPLAAVRRWEDAGGTWRLLHAGGGAVTVALCTCDGGEEVSRFTSTEPAVVAHLVERAADEDRR